MLVWKIRKWLFGRAGRAGRAGRVRHANFWATGSHRILLGGISRARVFRLQNSGNCNSWSRQSGHTKYESRCFGRATSTSVAKIAASHHGRESLKLRGFGQQSLDMPNFGLESQTCQFCRESVDMVLGPRPG